MVVARDAGRANRGSRIGARVGGYGFAVNGGARRIDRTYAERMAALIAWMLVVRVDDFVKDQRPPEVAALCAVLDKIINANRVLSKRSRPLSRPFISV